MSSNTTNQIINLQLGDIIEFVSPTDTQLDQKQFIIQFIDKSKILIRNVSGDTYTIRISETGSLENESIVSIILLSRAETPSYAKQHNLVPQQWIDIYFEGDVPVVMTGQIIELDEDQIEIKLISGDVIYIDFAYKGIPEDIPIHKFVTREKPNTLDDPNTEPKEMDLSMENISEEYSTTEATKTPFRERIKDIILDADQIQFGDTLGKVAMMVEVPEDERRYGIDRQTNDLLNELLSSIPNAQRTQHVLNNIHKMIERFKQMRDMFSKFDENGNAFMPAPQGSDFKPLVESLEQLNHKLYWILPVVRNVKKTYDIEEELAEVYEDISNYTLASSRIMETEDVQTFRQGSIPNGQNGYDFITKRVHEGWTPFNPPVNQDNTIATIVVNTNIASVIDNLGDLYSSVVEQDDIKRKRFIIQEYNLGLNTLESYRIKGGDNVIKQKKVTSADELYLKSFITLPESAVTFSRINLPSTNILIKSNLATTCLSYWQMLTTRTNLHVEPITDKPYVFNDTYLNRIREYLPNEERMYTYKEYLNKIIPKTKILFSIVNKHMKGRLSMSAVLDYLEPFMIYQKDISFKQYEEMTLFIKDKIQEWKKNYVTNKKEFHAKLRKPSTKKKVSPLLSLLKGKREYETAFMEGYKLDRIPVSYYNDSELLKHINDIDYGRYLNNTVAMTSSSLWLPDSIPDLLNDTITYNYDDTQSSTCDKTIAKKYTHKEDLMKDNDRTIAFDSIYDKTYYDVIKEYLSDLELLSEDEKIPYLKKTIQDKIGMSPSNAEREAEALVLGYKPVKNGDYAVFYNEMDGDHTYYVRTNNQWVLDEIISEGLRTENNTIFCNLKEGCIFVKDKCDTIDNAKIVMEQNNALRSLNETLDQDASIMDANIQRLYDNALSRIASLTVLKNTTFLKYDNKQFAYGKDAKEVMIEKSPYAETLSLILSQSDFVKRQNDISKFVSYYTRPALTEEDPWWLYCNISNVKLLPIFVSKLSEVFVKGEDYFSYLQTIMSEQGDLGSDGEAVIDKYSGWVISYIDFNTDEGFSEEGYVIRSREVMAADIGKSGVVAPTNTLDTFGDEETNTIARVMRSLSRYMGLDTSHLETFVLSETAKLLSKSMPTKEDYEKAAEANVAKGKKPKESFDIVYNQTLIVITVSYLLIGIQTSIPSLRTKKTYPGCVKSFSGYPSQGNSDKSGVEYLACVVEGIKSSIKPWNALKKLNQKKFITKMEGIINNFILPTEMMSERIRAKLEYDATSVEEYIPEIHDITNWINFLPPLKMLNVPLIEPPSEEFQKQFISDIKKGNPEQFNKINAMRSKIIFISLSIQQAIQKVVTKNISEKEAILTNNARVPFLENACCNDSLQSTYDYFREKEKSIQMNNNIVQDIRTVLYDVMLMSKPPILFDPTDTRILYPVIPVQFDEITIYTAFITYCKYNTNMPIMDDLRAICMDKPDDYDNNDTIQNKIMNLKQNGINYDNTLLAQLLTIVNKKNIVNLDLVKIIFNHTIKIRDRLMQSNNTILPKSFTEPFVALIDEFNNSTGEKGITMKRDMKNYLSKNVDDMNRKLSEFIRKHTTAKLQTDFVDCINNITFFKNNDMTSDTDTDIYQMSLFMKNTMELLVKVYPNIIIHTVKYENVKIPASWNLSEIHQSDLKKQTQEHFKPLRQFYDDEIIKHILTRFQYECNVIVELVKDTLYTQPKPDSEDNYLYDKTLIILLYRFYISKMLIILTELADTEDVSSTSVARPSNPMLVPLAQLDQLASEASLLEIIKGDNKVISEKIAKLISVWVSMICKDKLSININYSELKDKVTRGKEKEKDMIVEFLTEMSDEEREVENMFKNFRIGRWSVGMQKGFRQYEGDTYDKERSDIETRTILESRLKKIDGVTEGLMDMFALEAMIEESNADEMDQEDNEMPDWAAEDDNLEDDAYEDEY